MRVVTGQPVEASAFTIEPLDYQRSAHSDVARVEPDWIQGLPADETAYDADLVTPDWTSGMLTAAVVNDEPPPVLRDDPVDYVRAHWPCCRRWVAWAAAALAGDWFAEPDDTARRRTA